ncbi:MAG TPA: phosphomethylpyrimidine synthase ThiC, partial [Bacteroidia bacterium]|nr:phosphomethylpyrimidine synthase ThiC [Bacteroidia bacterium]
MSKKDKSPEQKSISTGSITGSRKIYVDGKLHNIKVAMREITLSPTKLMNGKLEINHPVTVYDASGPYTDDSITIDIKKGLPRIREQWIKDRNDVEMLSEVSSGYGKERKEDKSLDHLRFEHISKPMKAKPGMNVSQMHYAKK